jgi:hypothetical protein
MTFTNANQRGQYEMEAKTGFGIGVELEYVFPFNRNKWSVILEPTYQSYKAQQTNNDGSIFSDKASVDYSSIEFPMGIRHYFFLNNQSKLFVNAQYIFDYNLTNKFEFIDGMGRPANTLEGKSAQNFGYGIGYQYNNKYSVEFKYFTGRNILGNYTFWSTNYQNISIIFSYNLL